MISFKYLETVLTTENLWKLSSEETKTQKKNLRIVFWVGLAVNDALILCLAANNLAGGICACMTGVIDAACIGFSLFKVVKQKKDQNLTIDSKIMCFHLMLIFCLLIFFIPAVILFYDREHTNTLMTTRF
jgi:hypothetical protein